jgi:hypothetical protein
LPASASGLGWLQALRPLIHRFMMPDGASGRASVVAAPTGGQSSADVHVLLDVGCGSSGLAEAMAADDALMAPLGGGAVVLGIDISARCASGRTEEARSLF